MSQNEVEKMHIFNSTAKTTNTSLPGCWKPSANSTQPSLPETSLPPLDVSRKESEEALKAWGDFSGKYHTPASSQYEKLLCRERQFLSSLTQQAAEVETLKGERALVLHCNKYNVDTPAQLDALLEKIRLRAEESESQLLALRKPSEGLPERPKFDTIIPIRGGLGEDEFVSRPVYFNSTANAHFDALEAIIREKDAVNVALREDNDRMNQAVCDFQASSMLDVGNQGGPCRVEPRHLEAHIKDLRALASKSRAEGEQEGSGVALIAAERRRQVSVEGWTPEHDDGHLYGEIAKRAAALAVAHTDAVVMDDGEQVQPWKMHKEPRSLVIAAALLAAEIDRINRALLPATETESAG